MEVFGMKVKAQTLTEWIKTRKDFKKLEIIKSEDKGLKANTYVIAIHDRVTNEVYIVHSYEESR
jgi:hypothetical protein